MSDYNQDVQDALSGYAKGSMTATQTRKALSRLGYTADLREAKTGEVQVFPISDETVSGEYYAFNNGGSVKLKRRGTFKGIF